MPYSPHIKRLVDIVLSALAILCLSPLFWAIGVLVLLDSSGPPIFRHRRIGKDEIPFTLLKFRSMTVAKDSSQGRFEPGDRKRVTRIGAFLRRTKLDELPELFNVLKGEMSIVGPRPEVETYVRLYPKEFGTILKVRPGLSDLASVRYRNEEEILSTKEDPSHYYVHSILPEKLKLADDYLQTISFKTDLRIVKETLLAIWRPDRQGLSVRPKSEKQD